MNDKFSKPSTTAKPPVAAEPSMTIAAIGGLFIGILGFAVLNFFRDASWAAIAAPLVTGLLAGLLGAYIAAEPYDEMKRLLEAGGTGGTASASSGTVSKESLDALRDRLVGESTRFAREASSRGADGLILAEAAEVMRKEAETLSAEIN